MRGAFPALTVAIALLVTLATTSPLRAAGNPAALCDAAAAYASRETGVPVAILKAITRTETGRRRGDAVEPWPWTVNMSGKGAWFTTEDDARAFAYAGFKDGKRSFDVGCFQINFRWHGAAFASLSDMFDPRQNAVYAARFLADLYTETGDWSKAAGAYHSRTEVYAARYRDRFDRTLATLSEQPPELHEDRATTAQPRPLVSGAADPGRLGSLVPVSRGGGAHLLGRARAAMIPQTKG